MQTMQKRWLIMALRAFGALIIVMTALSQGTTQPFTFQGYLRDGTNPANGIYDFEFRLFTADDPPGGTQVGSTVTVNDLNVQNGLFTVQLNFGAIGTLWTGAERYLEIRVRPGASTGAYTRLLPRVKINPAPYSFYAFQAPWSGLIGIPAGFADGIDNDTTYSAGAGLQLVGTTFSIAPNGVVTSMLADNAVISAKIADGAVTDTKLSTTGVAAGTYGSATQVAQFTVNAQGRITAVSNVSIAGAGLWAASGTDIYNTNTGHVGVGTATPAYLLDVRGNRNTLLMNIVNANTGSTADGLYITVSGSAGWGLNSLATGANAIAVRGEATGANAWAGYFVGRGYFEYNSTITNATLRLHETEADFARLEFTNTNTARKWHIAGLIGGTPAADRLNLWNSSAGDVLSLSGDGSVAVGAPLLYTARLNVSADSDLNRATLRLHEAANDVARLEFTNTNTARKWHIAGYIGTGTDSTSDSIAFWNSGYPGHGGNIMRIRGDGTVEVRVLEITGADLAEKFPVTDKVEPGMVVEIDPDNPGNLRLARGAYNTRVAGVVAGANGLSKGIILGNLEGSESHVPVAISGRVWVYADATERAIEPGMLLTTSDKPGYAMAVRDRDRAQGAILGKAMTRLEKGKTGMVLVLVNLQ